MLVPFLLATGWLGQDPPPPTNEEVVIAVDLSLPQEVSPEEVEVRVFGQPQSSTWDPKAGELRLSRRGRWTAIAELGVTPCPLIDGNEFPRYRSAPTPIYQQSEHIEFKLHPSSVVFGRVSELAVQGQAWVTLTGPFPQANAEAAADVPTQVFHVGPANDHLFVFGGVIPGGYELGVTYWSDGTPVPLRSIFLRGEAQRQVDLRASNVSAEHTTLVRCRYEGLEVEEGLEFVLRGDRTLRSLGVRGLGVPIRPIRYEDGGFLFPFVTPSTGPGTYVGIRATGPYWIDHTVFPAGEREVVIMLEADLPPLDPQEQLLRDESLVGRVDIARERLGGLQGEVWVTLFPDTEDWNHSTIYFPGNRDGWSQPLAQDGTYEFSGLRIGPHTLQVELRGIQPPTVVSLPLERVAVNVVRSELPTRKDLFLAPLHPEGNLVVSLVDGNGQPLRQPAELSYTLSGLRSSLYGSLPFGGFHGNDLVFEWPEELLSFFAENQIRWMRFHVSTRVHLKGITLTPGQDKVTVEIK